MSENDVRFVVAALRSWKSRHLSWNELRQHICTEWLNGDPAWSRQSLQANEAIRIAWINAKKRLEAGTQNVERASSCDNESLVGKLQIELHELQTRYDNLALRHRQVIFNASLLPGGTRLLIDPLPDNSGFQEAGR